MVDSIGVKPSAGGDRSVARIGAATATTVVQTPVQPARPTLAQTFTPPTTAALGIAKAMAASPPVEPSRVAEIKKAIASGSFPILPATIADRLIALSLAWNSNDKA